VFGQPLDLLKRTEPVSRKFGFDRGTPIDRYYIEAFLKTHAADIRGRVLEVGDATYACRFGTSVRAIDVLHLTPGTPGATIVADLASADAIPSNTFDCIILTQTLQHVFSLEKAVFHLHRILARDGVLLATVPGISQISRYDMDRWGDFWRFTTASAARLFGAHFGRSRLAISSRGNVLASVAFLEGMAAQELDDAQLEHVDPDYQVVITIRAVRAA